MIDVLDRLDRMIGYYTGPQSASKVTKESIIFDLQNMQSELQLMKLYVTSPPDQKMVKSPPMVKIALDLVFNHDDLVAVAELNNVPVLRVVEIINKAINVSMSKPSNPEQQALWNEVFQYWKTKQQLPPWQLPELAKLILDIVALTVPGASLFSSHNVQIIIDVIQGMSPFMAAHNHDAPVEFVIHMLTQALPLLYLYISPSGLIPPDLLEIRKWAAEIIPLLQVFLINN